MDLEHLITGLIAAAAGILTLVVAFRIGVNPAQKALIDALNSTIGAQRERIAVLEAEVRKLREERDAERSRADRLEARVAKLERLLVDKLLSVGEDKIEALIARLADAPAES